MSFALGAGSLARLVGVAPPLVRVVKRAILITPHDFMVIEGLRTAERMWENYGKGRTAAECAAKHVPARYARPDLRKVTWLNDPLASKHGIQDDGFGHAVDVAPFPLNWNDAAGFDALAKVMLAAADIEKVAIRWGRDWDRDGIAGEKGETDGPHFELI